MTKEQQTSHIREYLQAVKSFSPSMCRFLLTTIMVNLTFFGLVAVLQNLFLLRLQFDAGFIGMMLGVGQLIWASAALPASQLSNRFGLRNSMIFGFALAGVGLAMILSVELLPQDQWRNWLLFSVAVEYLGAAFFTVNMAPYIMIVTSEKERQHAFSVFQALNPAMAFLGSLIAGILPPLWTSLSGVSLDLPEPYRLSLWLGPILLWASVIPLFGADSGQLKNITKQKDTAESIPFKWFIFFGVFVFVQVIGEGAMRTFFNVYLDSTLAVPSSQIGFIMGVAQLLPVVAALSTLLLITKFGSGNTLMVTLLGGAGCLLLLATEPQLAMAALAYMGTIAMITVTNTTRDLFGQAMTVPRWRTTTAAVLIIGVALGWATAGIIGGYLIDSLGFGSMFLAGSVLQYWQY